jgi:hypothetical protein
MLLAGAGYLVVAMLGAAAVRPVGPGSDRIFYLFLFVYSLLLVLVCSKWMKLLAIMLAIAFLVGVIVETKARRDSQRRLKECMQQHETSLRTDNLRGRAKGSPITAVVSRPGFRIFQRNDNTGTERG